MRPHVRVHRTSHCALQETVEWIRCKLPRLQHCAVSMRRHAVNLQSFEMSSPAYDVQRLVASSLLHVRGTELRRCDPFTVLAACVLWHAFANNGGSVTWFRTMLRNWGRDRCSKQKWDKFVTAICRTAVNLSQPQPHLVVNNYVPHNASCRLAAQFRGKRLSNWKAVKINPDLWDLYFWWTG